MDSVKEKNTNKKLKNTILILLLITVVAVFSILFILFKGSDIENITQKLKPEINEETFDLDEFVINLQPENGRTKNYAKVKVSLMYTNPKEEKILENSESKIRDRITKALRSKTATDMISIEKVESLKDTLRKEINEALKKEIIKDVYITDLVIQ